MDLRSESPYWLLKNGLIHVYPSLQQNLKTDIVIIGAGISGALAAWHLCKQGFEVTIVDRRHIAMGSTCASTSLLQYEIDTPLVKLAKLVGEANAVRSYELCRDAIYQLGSICKTLDADIGFELKPSFQYASFKKDVSELEEEYKLRKKHGFDIRWLNEKEVKEKFSINAPAGILSKDGAHADAYTMAHALLKQSVKKGLRVFDNTEITNIRHSKKKIYLKTATGTAITASKLIIACGYESQQYLPKKIEQLQSTYAIVSEPLPEKSYWFKNALIWETATPYLYARTTKDNRILAGGMDDDFYNPVERDKRVAQKSKQLLAKFSRIMPHIPFTVDFKWAGTFASTKDGLPYIGSIPQLPQTYFALGFGGNGITFSVIAARLITDTLRGIKNKDLSIFSFDR